MVFLKLLRKFPTISLKCLKFWEMFLKIFGSYFLYNLFQIMLKFSWNYSDILLEFFQIKTLPNYSSEFSFLMFFHRFFVKTLLRFPYNFFNNIPLKFPRNVSQPFTKCVKVLWNIFNICSIYFPNFFIRGVIKK